MTNAKSPLAAARGLLAAIEADCDGHQASCCSARARAMAMKWPSADAVSYTHLDVYKRQMQVPEGVRPDILCFLLPFLAFIGTILVIFFQTGALNLGPSVLIGFAVSVAYPVAKGYFKFEEVPGLIYQGAKSMVPVCVILSLAFGFGKAVEAVGFANFIVCLLYTSRCV